MSISNWLLSPLVAFSVKNPIAFLKGYPFDARSRWGTFHCPDKISAVQFIPRCQHEVEDEIRKAAKKGGLFVDVGAHIGRFSIMAAKLGMDVIALEPNKDNYHYARDNAEENEVLHKVELHQMAAWLETGMRFFHSSPRSDLGTLLPEDLHGNRLESGYDVWAVSLDDLLAKRQPVLIKIDSEGADFEILQGAWNTLRLKRPHVIFECVRMFRKRECVELLQSVGYRVKRVGQWNHLAVPA